MMIKDDLELSVTKEKLAKLIAVFERSRQDASGDPRVNELSQRSIKRLMNQLTEEIVRYEAHAGQHSR